MNRSLEKVSHLKETAFQRQKVYLEDLEIDESIETFERDLKKFLSKYGNILDTKILKNRKLTRRRQKLRVRHF